MTSRLSLAASAPLQPRRGLGPELRALWLLIPTFFVALAAMILLMIAVNAIPNDRIEKNVRATLPSENWPISPLNWGKLDGVTECITATAGLTVGKRLGVLESVFLSPSLDNCTSAQIAFKSDVGGFNYWRYWHGYQVISRPILFFKGIYSLRKLMFFLFCFSCFFFLHVLRKYASGAYASISLLALLSVPLYTTLLVSPNTLVWVLAFVSAAGGVTLARRNKVFFRRLYLRIFFLIGMLTSFVDMLTSPLVTLTLPLLALYWTGAWPEQSPARPSLVTAIAASGVWALGFALCWVVKWVIAIALFNGNPEYVIGAVGHRLAGVSDADPTFHPTAIMAIVENLAQGTMGLLIIGAFFLARLGLYLSGRVSLSWPFRSAGDVLTGGFLFLLPFAWMAVLKNHSFVHSWFVCQILYPSFALALGVMYEASHAKCCGREVDYRPAEPRRQPE